MFPKTEIEASEEFLPQYKEFPCCSFQNAVEQITDDIQDVNRFILLDIDGVLLSNLDKLPAVATLRKSQIDDLDQAYMMYLKEIYNKKIAITTDRNPKLNLFLSSKYVINKVREVNIPSEDPIPIFHSLNKQFCRSMTQKKDNLVNYIFNQLGGKSHFTLTSIEDNTFTVPNREIFPQYIAKELYRKHGIKCNIENYVVRR